MPSINKIIMYSFTGVLGIFVIDEDFEFFVTQKDFCPLKIVGKNDRKL